MALPGDGGVLSLEPSSVDMQGVVYAVKLTQDVAEKLIANDQALTLSLEKVGGGKLTVGEETMSLSVRDENRNNFECYSRQGNRCVKVNTPQPFPILFRARLTLGFLNIWLWCL